MNIAIKQIIEPTPRKFSNLVKSLVEFIAKKERARNIDPVVPRDIIINSVPLENIDIYRFSIGPSVNPKNPVNANVKSNPKELSLFAFMPKSNPK